MKILKLVSEFSKVTEYKINIQKNQLYFYAKNEHGMTN